MSTSPDSEAKSNYSCVCLHARAHARIGQEEDELQADAALLWWEGAMLSESEVSLSMSEALPGPTTGKRKCRILHL